MHQTRRGQQWYFGMKMHSGVDTTTGPTHSAVVSAANVHHKRPLPDMLHGNEHRQWCRSTREGQGANMACKVCSTEARVAGRRAPSLLTSRIRSSVRI